jgi:hypothetical protein
VSPDPTHSGRRLTAHIGCVHCGYDLFDREEDGVCPECGETVANSLCGINTIRDRRLLRRALKLLCISSLLSLACVGVCFLVLFVARRPAEFKLVVGLLHVLVFGSTIAVSFRAQQLTFRSLAHDWLKNNPYPTVAVCCDVLATLGLLIIVVAGILLLNSAEGVIWAAVALGFMLNGLTTFRHWCFFRVLALAMVDPQAQSSRRSLLVLGFAKCVYEAIWLSCIWLAIVGGSSHFGGAMILAYAGLFGCVGFFLLTVWTIPVLLHVRARVGQAGNF